MSALRPAVYFKTTLPDDMVENEQGQILQYPGRGVSLALTEMLQGLGYTVSALENLEYRGWEFHVIGEAVVWFRVTEIDEFLVITYTEPRLFGLLGPSKATLAFHATLVTKLNQLLRGDQRFLDVRWVFENEIETDAPGAPEPVS